MASKTLEEYYNEYMETLSPQTITYNPLAIEEQTQEGLSSQISEYLRPYYDRAISSRQTQTAANRAEFDVDAASRGMTPSTWLSDVKRRENIYEASDIASLESEYGASLAESVFNAYQAYLDRKAGIDSTNAANQLQTDIFNSEAMTAAEKEAYARALEMYQLLTKKTTKPGGDDDGGDDDNDDDKEIPKKQYWDWLRGSKAIPEGRITFSGTTTSTIPNSQRDELQ